MKLRLLALAAIVLLACSCGQKGPLFRPGQDNNPPSSLTGEP